MLKRKAYYKLLEWKNNKEKKCLVVKGARQIGKTYIIKQFGRENYKRFVYINFLEEPEYKDIFAKSLAAKDIYTAISLKMGADKLVKGDTLIFLDEIQACPNARTALKFLSIDKSYDVIASGSLLGISYKGITSIPVGYEEYLDMHSLDFEEFLWACGVSSETIGEVKQYFDNKQKVDDSINNIMFDYLRQYIVVGGMPEVVNTFITTKNYGKVHQVQMSILTSYQNDIMLYAETYEKPKITNCYISIPNQLSKENKKFQFSVVEKGATSRKFGNSVDWMRDANLVNFCVNVTSPEFPLAVYERYNFYKLYVSDIGLLVAMYGFETKDAIIYNKLQGNAKGGIYENLMADILVKKNYKLRYYKSDNSSMEIEFLINDGMDIIPIEVKAGNERSLSLNLYIDKFKPKYAYKFVTGNVGISESKITLPLYMAMFLPNKLFEE